MLPESNNSLLRGFQPRWRLLAAAGLSVLLAVCETGPVVVTGLAVAAALVAAAAIPPSALAARLAAVNALAVALLILLPLGAAGEALFAVGPFGFSRDGVVQALIIAGKANAIVLVFTALVTTLSITQLGRALRQLGVPDRLAVLFLLASRYLTTIQDEYRRLRRAMRVRGFRPQTNRHTLRTVANLVALLVIRGIDRGERIMAAMKCRGFTGTIPSRSDRAMTSHDAAFLAAAALIVILLGTWEWSIQT